MVSSNFINKFAKVNLKSLPGGIPGNKMKIKQSENLVLLANESGNTINQVSKLIVGELIHRNIVEDSGDNWGYPISECYDRDIYLSEMVDVLVSIGISPVRSFHIDALMECYLFGDNDCPECGGKMYVKDGAYRVGYTGHDTQPDVHAIWEKKVCANCNYEFSK